MRQMTEEKEMKVRLMDCVDSEADCHVTLVGSRDR